MNDKSTVIPRPVTKRQFSSPANCGVAHINLSDVVAKINNGPKSCTNPFLNGSLSISEDDNSNSIDLNVNKNQYNSNIIEQPTQIITENLQKNPFSKRRNNDDISFFSFPTNGNILDGQSTANTNFEITDTIDTLIELNETTPTANNSGITLLGQLNNIPHNQIHTRSLSDTGSKHTLTSDIYEQSTTTTTTNPFAGNLHKTVSDTFLEQYSTQQKTQQLTNNTINRTTNRQSMQNSCIEQQQQVNSPQTPAHLNGTELKRAMSCDSVNSESSVLLGDLEQQPIMPTITGQLCVGLQYDK